MGYAGGDQNMDFPIGDVIDNEKASYCSEGCLDPWLADGFCDEGKVIYTKYSKHSNETNTFMGLGRAGHFGQS